MLKQGLWHGSDCAVHTNCCYLQPRWTELSYCQSLAVSWLSHCISVWQRKAFEAQGNCPPPLQGIPLHHNLIAAVGALHSRTASGLCQPCFMCAQDRAAREVPPFRTWAFAASPSPSLPESLTSWVSCFMLINFPWYFIVTEQERCLSAILAFSMVCKSRTGVGDVPFAAEMHQGYGTCTQEERDRHELYRK